MCLAIMKPAHKLLSREALSFGYENNPHGAGFAYSHNGKLYVRKGFFDFSTFWAHFNGIQKNNPAMVHFRHANVGDVNAKNCHPWRIDENHAMIHNGTFFDFVDMESKVSDTGNYTRLLLKPLFKRDMRFWKTTVGRYLLEKTMGPSKMVILSNQGEFLILRENAGLWDDDCWYSNDGFREYSEYAGTTLPWQYEFNFSDPETENNQLVSSQE